MKKKKYEAPSILLENFGSQEVFMVSAEIPGGWFDDYGGNWENNN